MDEICPEIKIRSSPFSGSNKSNHYLAILGDGTILEEIYLNNDCNENTVEHVLLHEFIHVILFNFLDKERLDSLLPKLINDGINLSEYMKRELISSKYDCQSKLIAPSENYFSSLLEDWNSEEWLYSVDYLMKIQ